jgi:glyoxylase-like metal-dependent hydrolase (beta-lactamase superfamily II)
MLQVVSATNGVLASPKVHCFFHQATNTCSYIVECTRTKKAAILDSVLDYGLSSGKVGTEYADEMVKEVEKEGLSVEWILDTHVHADHITGMAYLKKKLPGAKTAISERIKEVQRVWAEKFEWTDFDCSGSQWDFLLADPIVNESTSSESLKELKIGDLIVKPLPTPGHTPACMCLLVGDDTLFTGDAIFQPDFGTARCDFPGGSSATLYDSISKTIYSLPDTTRIFVGHDYPPASRQVTFLTDIAAEKASNKYLTADTSKDDFIIARDTRDSQLDVPNLIYPSLQFNLNAGSPPPASSNGQCFVKTPLHIPKGLDF